LRDASKNRIPDLAAASVTRIVGLMPWRMAMAVGAGLGRVAGSVARRKRQRTIDNLRVAGVTDPLRSYRETCSHFGRNMTEMLWILSHPKERILKRIETEGLDELGEAAQEGKGVLVVSAHYGNWELMPLVVANAGIPLTVIARKMSSPWLERRVLDWRSRAGVRSLIHSEAGASITAYRWLAQGGVLGCLMDRSIGERRARIPFLGRQAHVPLGPAQMAAKGGARVFTGFADRRRGGTTAIRFRRLREAESSCPQTTIEAIGRALEEQVRSSPEQWFWIYRRSSSWRADAAPIDPAT
jgi:KDO2-lipid IV(A) lauroyltransferase